MAHYLLDKNGQPYKEKDLLTWAQEFEAMERHLAVDIIKLQKGSLRVSTVFLGIDHSFGGQEPVLWETMVFASTSATRLPAGLDDIDEDCERYSSRAAALEGHRAICQRILDAIAGPQVRIEKPQLAQAKLGRGGRLLDLDDGE